ncbi:MAG: hypothetical protein QXK06_04280 [Candidatus Diapherotrites archaeon]
MEYKTLFLFFAISFFCSSALAEISASIRPKSNQEVLELYPFESGILVASFRNNGDTPETNISVKWEAGEGLAICNNTSGSSDYFVSTINSLLPGEEKRFEVKVKPVAQRSAARGKMLVSVLYGKGSYDYYAGTHVQLREPVLQFDASLDGKKLKPGSQGSVWFSLKNVSESEIRVKNARLVLPSYFYEGGKAGIGTTVLASGGKTEGKLEFGTEKNCSGENTIVLVVEFDDAFGLHSLEKDFNVECRTPEYGLLPYIALVVLLIIFLFYVKQREFEKKKSQSKGKA